MTIGELINKLREFPPGLEVMIEVRNQEAIPTDIDWCVGGISSWVVIHDYKAKETK